MSCFFLFFLIDNHRFIELRSKRHQIEDSVSLSNFITLSLAR